MRSKTSLFNKAVFKSNLIRFWPIWASYFITLLLIVPGILSSSLRWTHANSSIYSVGLQLLNTGIYSCVIVNAVFGVISAMGVYSFMYTSKSAGMAASLPIRREGMFFTCYISGLLWLIAAPIVTALVAGVIEASYGFFGLSYLLQWLSACIMQAVFFYGLASLCAVLTGTLFVLPAVYAIFNVLAVVVEFLIRNILQLIVFGFCAETSGTFRFLSPIFLLMESRVSTVTGDSVAYASYSGMTALVWYLIAGLIMAALALLIYRKRRMEAASDIVAVQVLKPVFRYCMAFGFSITLGLAVYYLVFEMNPVPVIAAIIFSMLLAGFIGYFAAEMLIRKSFKVFDKWRGFAVFALAVIVLMCAADLNLFGFETYVPDADKVESICVSAYGNSFESSNKDEINTVRQLHEALLAGENGGSADSGYYSFTVTIYYYMNNGGTVSRSYTSNDASIDKLNEVFNSPSAIKERYSTEFDVTPENINICYVYGGDTAGKSYSLELTAQEACELYSSCIVPDMDDCIIGQIDFGYFTSEYSQAETACYIDMEFMNRDLDGNYSYDHFEIKFDPSVESRTSEYLKSLGLDLS